MILIILGHVQHAQFWSARVCLCACVCVRACLRACMRAGVQRNGDVTGNTLKFD